jgi:hypothetical protein
MAVWRSKLQFMCFRPVLMYLVMFTIRCLREHNKHVSYTSLHLLNSYYVILNTSLADTIYNNNNPWRYRLWRTLAGWAAAADSLSRLHQTVLGWHVVSTSNPTAAFSAFQTGPLLLYWSNYSVYPISESCKLTTCLSRPYLITLHNLQNWSCSHVFAFPSLW